MTIEQRQQTPSVERTEEQRKLHNLIQIDLIKRWAKKRGLDDDTAAMEWTGGRHFSKPFSDLVKSRPEWYEEYKDEKHRAQVLARIETELYGENWTQAA